MSEVGTASLSVSPSDVVSRGDEVALVARFWIVDAVSGAAEAEDPASVLFTVLAPDETTLSFSDLDPNVSNPAYGVFVCVLDASLLLPTGTWHANAVGSDGSSSGAGLVAQTPDEAFVVVESAVDVPAPPPRPVLGPCTQWISGADVAACARVDYGESPHIFDTAAYDASTALYEISGRQFPGICERTVRPPRGGCGCGFGGSVSYGGGPWFWTTVPWGFGGGAWQNEGGDRLGCAPLSRVKLAGYPVVQILEVKLDGVVMPEFDPSTGARNWRLDHWRYLVRMDDPSTSPATPRFWPSCDNFALDDDQPGTFAVTYRWGTDVPQLGRAAAVELANQFWLACGGAECQLPAGVVRAVRQGIEVDRGLLANWMDTSKGVGLVSTDAFLAAYCRGQRGGRKSALWSPDVRGFGYRTGVNQ